MIKFFYLFFLMLFLAQNILAQKFFVSDNPKYVAFIMQADSAFEKQKFQISMANYDSAFAISQKSAYSLYHAANCATRLHKFDKAFSYLHKSIEINPLSICKLIKGDSVLRELSKEMGWQKLETECELKKSAFLSKINASLLEELQTMCKVDMEARKGLEVLKQKNDYKSPDFKKQKMLVESIENGNLLKMKEIISKYGWTGYSLVGEEGEKAAWYLVCHADSDIPFQKNCLTLMSQAAEKGETSHTELAFLMDKVLISEHQQQMYGTQIQFNLKTKQYEPRVGVLDKEYLDVRREAMGLESWKDFLERVKRADGRR